MKHQHFKKAKKMVRLVAAGRHRQILFTDEKIFIVEHSHNHQNDIKLLLKGSPALSEAVTVSRSHFPQPVMVWAGVCFSGKTPLVFIEKRTKMNDALYQDCILKDVLNPWARDHFG